jgi:hypothetical protein
VREYANIRVFQRTLPLERPDFGYFLFRGMITADEKPKTVLAITLDLSVFFTGRVGSHSGATGSLQPG